MMLVWAVLLASVSGSQGARVLALLPYNARSHWVVMEPLLMALRARGHHLTVVSSFPPQQPLDHYHHIDLSRDLPAVISNYTVESIRQTMPDLFHAAVFITKLHMHVCEKVMRDPRVLKLMDDKFDLVITEIFGSDCVHYFAHKLNVPFISFVTSTALPWDAERTGLPNNPSYIPNYFVDFREEMSFLQRMFNALTLVYARAVYYYLSEIPSHRLAEEVLGGPLPPMAEVNRQTALVLVNSHHSLAQSRPLPPNVVEVGGIHVKETRPLPKLMKEALDNAKDGVILFSFGSLVRVSSLPPHIIDMFLSVFSTLPQLVVFKYEEDLPQAPPNVLVQRWLPQADIIAHPKVRAVITHCGLASTIEAVHFATPLVGVPFFSDQFKNAKNVVRRGGGVILDIDNLTASDISTALHAVLHDDRYAQNMARLSQQFRDRPQSPLATAVYWTEYVIRHQGAPQLRPASTLLSAAQYLLLDVVAVLLAGLAAVCSAALCCCSLLCRRKPHTRHKTKKTKKTN